MNNSHKTFRNRADHKPSYSSNHSRRRGHQRTNTVNRTQSIDPNMFVNVAVELEAQAPFSPKHSFAEFGFDSKIVQALISRGYKLPTPIQDGTIPAAMQGKDIIGLANTGTGKTAAFLLPILHRLMHELAGKQALIIVPTRELSSQIQAELNIFSQNTKIRSAVCVGGMSMDKQINQLSRRPQVIIGTPGRLKDLILQKKLHLNNIGIFVLDEADRMLDMGFVRDIRNIADSLPRPHQSLCFSATMTPPIDRLIHELLIDPVTVSVVARETCDNVHQDIVHADTKEEKVELLKKMLGQDEFSKVLIFGKTKYGVQRLAETLTKSGIRAEAIHGNKSQPQRQRALDNFKSGRVDVLVATDVAARGLDIPHVSHVINFDQPENYKDYIHRIGRTGRAGRLGKALTFVN